MPSDPLPSSHLSEGHVAQTPQSWVSCHLSPINQPYPFWKLYPLREQATKGLRSQEKGWRFLLPSLDVAPSSQASVWPAGSISFSLQTLELGRGSKMSCSKRTLRCQGHTDILFVVDSRNLYNPSWQVKFTGWEMDVGKDVTRSNTRIASSFFNFFFK